MLLTARTPSRYASALAALSVFMAALLLPLSFTGGVMTTPAIQQSLGGSPAALSWLTNGFMLTFGSFLLAAGVTADAIDRKRIFIAGAALLCLSSLLFCLTHNLFLSGVLRALQGLAAAMILASGSAALAQLYDGAQRTRAFSILGTVFGIGLAFGPLLIGFMIDAVGWRGVYALFALLSAGVLLIGLVSLPATEKSEPRTPDNLGLTLFTLALMLFTASLMVIPARGFLSLTTLALLIASGGLFVAFVVRCRRVNNPVLELSLLRHPRFVGVLLLPVATCCCYVVLLIIVPLHFMGGEGMSESQSALYLMALTTPMLVFPSVAALLTRWFSPGQVSTAGLMMASVGLLLLGDAFHSNHLPQLVLALILCGAGAALPWGLMDGLAISAVPVAKAGMAAGLFNTVRVAGEGIALAVVSAVLTASNTLTLQSRVHGYAPEVIRRAAGWLGAGNMPQAAALLPDFSLRVLRESYDSAYTLLFSGLAVVTLLCALMIWLTLCRKGGAIQTRDSGS
ncbi:MFS transporter [Klebsiella pneumoniae]|uniref:MFS transporter n=1 Tax=Klebsiella pneumoniae TaxID=573 RepID=UPI00284481F7|nr:MFS transporter [Klebsiella pneumoniae]MDR4669429.1 MFS transporter [Klebsiella pneumoniae]